MKEFNPVMFYLFGIKIHLQSAVLIYASIMWLWSLMTMSTLKNLAAVIGSLSHQYLGRIHPQFSTLSFF